MKFQSKTVNLALKWCQFSNRYYFNYQCWIGKFTILSLQKLQLYLQHCMFLRKLGNKMWYNNRIFCLIFWSVEKSNWFCILIKWRLSWSWYILTYKPFYLKVDFMLMGSKAYEDDILSNSFAWLQRKFAGLKSILNKYFLFIWLCIFPRFY